MIAAAPYKALTFALHPNTRGFGWVAFSGPLSPFAWGTVGVTGRDKNTKCLRRLNRLLDRLSPETLVMEAFERTNSSRQNRVANLCRAIAALAISRGANVVVYPFRDVQRCFSHIGARTRQDIAEAVARTISAFESVLPKRRRSWDAESRRMPLFSAAALAMVHYQLAALTFLDAIARPDTG